MITKKATGILVKLKQAEKVRKYLFENKLLRTDMKISKDDSFIYLPVKEVSKEMKSYSIIEKEFEMKETKPRTYKEIVSIADNLRHDLPTSYDIVGDIILIKLSKNLLKYQKEIGESLLKINRKLKENLHEEWMQLE